nr:uncharacterized protein K02A2.6-like [Lytechinus pictus]
MKLLIGIDFFTRQQAAGETLEQYITDLKVLASSCNFRDLQDSLLRDRIIGGIKDDAVRARLLRESDLTLDKAIQICRAAELSKERMTVFDKAQDVHAVRKAKMNGAQQKQIKCKFCGRSHVFDKNKCPAFGKKCNKCQKDNHFASVCTSAKPAGKVRRDKKSVNAVDEEAEDVEELFVDVIRAADDTDDWFVDLKVNSRKVRFKLDTGSQCNIIPELVRKELQSPLRKSNSRLIVYSEHKMKPVGKTQLICEHKSKFFDLECQVVELRSQPILGLPSCKLLGLVKRTYAVREETTEVKDKYPHLFQGLGCMPGKHQIHAPRRLPVALREKVREELKRMEDLNVIERVTQPTAWVNSMVTVAKKNSDRVRICLDPKELNQAIEREHYPMRTIEEVVACIPNAKIFSTLDANCGYWQLQLDEASSDLCTFNTPFGRYKYIRMPFGINSAPEIFQRTMSQMLEGLEGVDVVMDDILIWGTTRKEHDERLDAVFRRLQENNVRLNESKCKIAVDEVKYIGHLLTANGLKPDMMKVEAVKNMTQPANKKELQRYLGMINYLGKFLPNLSEVTAPLRKLLVKENDWQWHQEHTTAFEKLQQMATEAPILQFYDVNQPVTVSVDASQNGVGAVLLQNEKPVAYASKAFTDCEKRYAQIEKELAAVVYGAEKFHQYVFMRKFEIESDHKPLETIMKKPLADTPPRLQRMLLKLQKYDCKLTYKRGKEMYIADALSRDFIPKSEVDEESQDIAVCMVDSLPMSAARRDELEKQTQADPELRKLMESVKEGWPEMKQDADKEIRQYWQYRDDITTEGGLLFKLQKVIIPSSMRKLMLEKLHQSHQGVEKTKRLARDVLFWPGMNADIAELVERCDICSRHRASNQKEPMHGHDLPGRPWQKIGSDLFEFDGSTYLILVDYYLNYFEINKLTSTSSKAVIAICKQQFARHGVPDEVISDNGPQYASAEFHQFCVEYGVTHKTSSPRYPQSNGKSEKAVQIAKNLLKKSADDGKDVHLALLAYRNTPGDGLPSPAQMLMGRRTKTTIPTSGRLLQPSTVSREDIIDRKKELQRRQKQFYDKGTKDLSVLEPCDMVTYQDGKVWRPAVVIKKDESPRSYIIEGEGGVHYRRNRRHLQKRPGCQLGHYYDDLEEVDTSDNSNIATSQRSSSQDNTQRGHRCPQRKRRRPVRLDL